MALLLRNGAVFLHIPKTGGSFVTQVLEDLDAIQRPLGHIHGGRESALSLTGRMPIARTAIKSAKGYLPYSLKRAGKAMVRSTDFRPGQVISDPYTFCFVRDPITWYESFWRYMIKRSGPDWSQDRDLLERHPCGALAPLGHEKFECFVEAVATKEPGFVTQLYGRYIADGVDFVGRQESLIENLADVLDQLDVPHDPGQLRSRGAVNASGQSRVSWPRELRAEIERLEYPTRVRFGYDVAGS